MEENRKKSAAGVSSLVLGIISILSGLFYYISLPTGILSIILGAKSTKKTGSRLGKSGLVTGIVGVSICVFLYISMVVILWLANNY